VSLGLETGETGGGSSGPRGLLPKAPQGKVSPFGSDVAFELETGKAGVGFSLGCVVVTGESRPLSPVLGLAREQLLQSLELTREQLV